VPRRRWLRGNNVQGLCIPCLLSRRFLSRVRRDACSGFFGISCTFIAVDFLIPFLFRFACCASCTISRCSGRRWRLERKRMENHTFIILFSFLFPGLLPISLALQHSVPHSTVIFCRHSSFGMEGCARFIPSLVYRPMIATLVLLDTHSIDI